MPQAKPRAKGRQPRRSTPVATPKQAIVVRAPDPKPWLLSQDEVSILKNAVCKGATDEELKFCLAVARRYQLDPFQKQIWFVPRWDNKAQDSDGQEGGKVYVPVVGIDGLLHIASTHHPDFGTFSEPEYGPLMEVTYGEWSGPKGHRQCRQKNLKVPEWCRIEAWKKGCAQPTVAKVWWEEIYPNIDRAPLVRRMPRLMLAKCARAQAIRASYPKTGGLLIPEETQTREFQQITPEGRVYAVESPEPENKFLSAYEEREREQLSKLTPAQREVVERKMAERQKGGNHENRENEGPDLRSRGTQLLPVGHTERPGTEDSLLEVRPDDSRVKSSQERKPAEGAAAGSPHARPAETAVPQNLFETEYVDPKQSECPECKSSFGVHLKTCSKFGNKSSQAASAKPGAGKIPNEESAAPKPTAYYVWHEESETATILQPTFAIDASLKKILKGLVRQGHVAPSGEELENLKFEFEKRGYALVRHKE